MLAWCIALVLAQAPASDEEQIRQVVSSFRAAVEGEQPQALGRLFWPDALVYEHGGEDQGVEAFVQGHMVPHFREMDFKWTSESNQGRSEGAIAYVAQRATLEVRRGKEAPAPTDNTFTFVLRKKEGTWRITHLHWSLRSRPAAPVTRGPPADGGPRR